MNSCPSCWMLVGRLTWYGTESGQGRPVSGFTAIRLNAAAIYPGLVKLHMHHSIDCDVCAYNIQKDLTLARTGGGVGATPPPLRFFADSKKNGGA